MPQPPNHLPTNPLGQDLHFLTIVLAQHGWTVDVAEANARTARLSAHKDASAVTFSERRRLVTED